MIPLATFAIVQNSPIARGTVHHVQAGDSLWSISRRYKTTSSELKRINGLTSDFLQIGDKIRVSEHSQADTHVTPIKTNLFTITELSKVSMRLLNMAVRILIGTNTANSMSTGHPKAMSSIGSY